MSTIALITAANVTEKPPATLPRALLPFAPLHKRALGVACGVVVGGCVWLGTVLLLLKGGPSIGPNLSLLAQYFYGYRVTWAGSLMGLAWGFALGFVVGWTFAALRNFVFRVWLNVIRALGEKDQYRNILDRL